MYEDKPYLPVDPSPAAVDPTFSWWGLIGMTLVFLLILFIGMLIIRSIKKTTFGISDAKWLRIIDRQPLAGQQVLYLVEIAGKLQVLGGSDHGVVKITEIDDPDLATEILTEIAARPYEQDGGILPNIFSKITSLTKRRNFADEMEDFMEEADDEDFHNKK